MLNYQFKNRELLKTALTHSSYANEHGIFSNERLEFLGDAVLELAMSEILFKKEQIAYEGDLTKLRSSFVCERYLSDYAKKIRLQDMILFGKGIENKNSRGILADTVEAIIGAVFLDSDYETARDFVEANLFDIQADTANYKSELKELLDKKGIFDIEYILIESEGEAHDKTFTVECVINGESFGFGTAKRKKDAEKLAAKTALEKIHSCEEL